MEKQTQPKEKKQHMANPTGGATTRILKKKKKKKLMYGLLIHQVKQKLKSEKEKPNVKKKNLISHQRLTDGASASNSSNKLISHHQSNRRSE